jgi:hypothetical protein
MVSRWIRDSGWMLRPHGKERAPGLWWYQRDDRQRVIDAYLDQRKRRQTPRQGLLAQDFKAQLSTWIEDLNLCQNLKAWGDPHTWRYWTVPAYALANRIEKGVLIRHLRELEGLAKAMFPDDVPNSRRLRAALTEDDIRRIRQLYLEGTAAKIIAARFRIPPSRVGQLCREQKAIRTAERERMIIEHLEQVSDSTLIVSTNPEWFL